MEHRWGRRVMVDIPIQVTVADPPRLHRARLANVSVSGALIEADYTLRVLARLIVLLESSHTPADPIGGIAAYVARSHPHGFGVEWCDRDSQAVTDLIRAATAPPVGRKARPETRPAARLGIVSTGG